MKIIGITGVIGSGKSTVADIMAEMGATVLNTDKLGHEVLLPHSEGWREVIARFGEQILSPDGSINRKKLGEIVFNNSETLNQLNQITHPKIYKILKEKLEEYQRQGKSVVVIEAALLLEAGWVSLVDEIWVTIAPEATILQRLSERSGMPRAESLIRIRSQLSPEEQIGQAKGVIDTDCSLDKLKENVKDLWQRMILDTPPS
ncbi:dephospho-CoA kinase [Chloroflexota bacterium]